MKQLGTEIFQVGVLASAHEICVAVSAHTGNCTVSSRSLLQLIWVTDEEHDMSNCMFPADMYRTNVCSY